MRDTKYSGIDSIGNIPSNWDVTRIKNILTLRSEKNSGDRELLSVYLDRGVIAYSESTGMQVILSQSRSGLTIRFSLPRSINP